MRGEDALLKLDSLIRESNTTGVKRNVINGQNQLHYELINPYPYKKKLIITWPFRMIGKFFVSWKREGIKKTLKKVPVKIKYAVNRILGRVDKNNNYIVK